MRIRRPRGITPIQLMVVSVIGVIGGVYIWQPLILRFRKETGAVAEPGKNELPKISEK